MRRPVPLDAARRRCSPSPSDLAAALARLGLPRRGGRVRSSSAVAVIVVVAWFVGALAIFFEDLGLARYRIDTADNRIARRVRTQVLILRRLTLVVVVVIAAGAILLGFPGVEAVGASVLASAGLVSVVAGLAAQSTLANVFAGIQLAFSDAIRIDDVVVVEGQWGLIEEITLSYVVVHIWDDRRLVLPSTYFTTTPFENWTRRNSELLGAVELDLDWRVDPGRHARGARPHPRAHRALGPPHEGAPGHRRDRRLGARRGSSSPPRTPARSSTSAASCART